MVLPSTVNYLSCWFTTYSMVPKLSLRPTIRLFTVSGRKRVVEKDVMA